MNCPKCKNAILLKLAFKDWGIHAYQCPSCELYYHHNDKTNQLTRQYIEWSAPRAHNVVLSESFYVLPPPLDSPASV